jgi:hypothetical protein
MLYSHSGKCRLLLQPSTIFTANIIFTYIAMCIERAYSSYRIGRHQYLDVYKAYRPVMYTWLVTLILYLLPLLVDCVIGTFTKTEWHIVLPACMDTYVNEKMYFSTNITDTIVDANSIPLGYAVAIYALLEFTPLFLLLYISKRNYRLLREYSANRTHESIAIGVTLNRNNLTTKVSD